MEPKSETIFPIKTTKEGDLDNGKAKKKSGAMQIFWVAVSMLRRHFRKAKPVDMNSDKGMWKQLLGSMRPLHIQGNESTQAAAEVVESPPLKSKDHFEEALSPPLSPRAPSRLSSFTESQYASASNLQELDDGSDDHEEAMRDENGGDEMIDAKAEEFIAQFYKQMRLQRHNVSSVEKKKPDQNQVSR